MYFHLKIYHSQPRDIGYLLHKHPDRCQQLQSHNGSVHLFYPEIASDFIRFVLFADFDPISLLKRSTYMGRHLGYVNDRPYVCGSIFSSILSKVLGSALNGHCKEKPDLIDESFSFELELGMLSVQGEVSIARQLFEALSYETQLVSQDYPKHPLFEGKRSNYMKLRLKGIQKLSVLLRHLYVLLPVLDNYKHYYFSHEEVEKLLEKGRGWLDTHPSRDLIVKRYLYRRQSLVRQALMRLNHVNQENLSETQEAALERPLRLNDQRIHSVISALGEVQSVVDLGCGEGSILKELLDKTSIPFILGVDVASSVLEKAERRLKLERRPQVQRQRIQLLHSSVLYRDQRLQGTEAALLIEVIEHLEPGSLGRLAKTIWGELKPHKLIVTTPNREFNAFFEMQESELRHPDHRFEWSRIEFQIWCQTQARNYGYELDIKAIGPEHELYGPPTQMAVFTRVSPL